MERSLAERLVGELKKHPLLDSYGTLDTTYFIDLLTSTEIPPSKKFYEEVKGKVIQISESGGDLILFLSIERILRNKLAGNYKLSKLKKAYDALISRLGEWDSDVLTRRLRMNEDAVRMMTQALIQYEQPHSLLAKLTTVNTDSKEVTEGPLVIIPYASDLTKISAWELANTHPIEEGLLSRIRRVSKQKYFSHK